MHEDSQFNDEVSRMTYIQAPKDEPLNLDMSAFDRQAPIESSSMTDDKQD